MNKVYRVESPDQIEYEQPRLVDGFAYLIQYRYQPAWFVPHVFAQFEVMRRANNLRPFIGAVPNDPATSIAPYDTYTQQLKVEPGSLLYAMVSGPSVNNQAISLNVTETSMGVPIANDFCTGYNTTLGNDLTLGFLANPRIIGGEGTLNVEICNLSEEAITPQILFLFATPLPTLPSDYFGDGGSN